MGQRGGKLSQLVVAEAGMQKGGAAEDGRRVCEAVRQRARGQVGRQAHGISGRGFGF